MKANTIHTRSSPKGFTVVGLVMALGVMGAVSGMAVLQLGGVPSSPKGEGAVHVLVSQMNTARRLSITQGRQVEVQFVGTNQVRVVQEDDRAGTTVLSKATIEDGAEYGLVPSVPDTPDAFGNGRPIAFGKAARIIFNSDGTLRDQNGNTLNGTVFVVQPGHETQSARAVTVVGVTGRVRGYKWDGKQWDKE